MAVKATPPLIFGVIKQHDSVTIQVKVLNGCGWHTKWFADVTFSYPWKGKYGRGMRKDGINWKMINWRKVKAYYKQCPCAVYETVWKKKGTFDNKTC